MFKKDRNTLFPIIHRDLYDLYKTQMRAFWTADEVDLSGDLKDLEKMQKPAQDLILKVLAFFAQSDSIVNENLCFRFVEDVNIPEALQFYNAQIGIEAVHAETYAKMIESYVLNENEKNKLFKAIENFEFIAKKAQWMKKWIMSQESFSKRLLAFAAVEGIFFSGSFCTIYWVKEMGKMPGLSQANDFIARDEGLHWIFASKLYKELDKIHGQIKSREFFLRSRLDDKEVSDAKLGEVLREIDYLKKQTKKEFIPLTQKDVEELIKEAVSIEKSFIQDSLPVSLLGLNSDLMGDYIESVADIIVQEFGFEKIYNTVQPFDFMIKNDVRGKVNFFESRATEYQKAKRESVDFEEISEDF